MIFRSTILAALVAGATAGQLETHVNAGCVWPCVRRRQLSQSSFTSFQGHEDELKSHMESCGHFEYEVALFSDGHLHAVAVPKEDAVAAGCPMASVHTLFEDNTAGRKEIMVWKSLDEGKDVYSGAYNLGSFKLSELKSAYDKSDANAPGHKVYDAVTNNCGSLMMDLASNLDVEIDAGLTKYVVTSLVEEAGQKFFDNIRASTDFSKLFDGRHLRSESASDEQLVQLLVEKQATGFN